YETEATNVVQTSGGYYKESNNDLSEISYSVISNYPNPFNPTTTIRYNLSESGNVKLVITNSLGKEVRILGTGFKEAGEYLVILNSENLPSGIYICSLITNGGITSNKMLLLR
ncbi:MAG: T9SS type A sorting domain-containing protein, partial [Ignavibacteriaceae bacterium]|nr:T9SS type A sorting domain-containing protein [Ignavibacteriaceae bacterium]